MGVTSVIAVTSRPVASRARIAASRPAPGPRTKTSIVRRPWSIALRAAFSAVTCAAYGVLFREPFQPEAPAEAQAITFPCGSVSETIVLLNEALMCAAPRGTVRFSRLRRGAGFAPPSVGAGFSGAVFAAAFSWLTFVVAPLRSSRLGLRGGFLLAGDGLAGSAARARVRPRALATHWERLAVTQPAIRADLLEALDV